MDAFTTIALFLSAVGGAIASLLGGWDALLETLVLLMIIDIATGMTLSVWGKRSVKTESGGFSSTEFYRGITRKFLCFGIIMVAVALDSVTGMYMNVGEESFTLLRSVVIVFYIVCEATSIVENSALLGVPIPQRIRDVLDVLKEKKD